MKKYFRNQNVSWSENTSDLSFPRNTIETESENFTSFCPAQEEGTFLHRELRITPPNIDKGEILEREVKQIIKI